MTVNHELEASLTTFLERFSPPRHIAGNPAAMREEMGQLLDAFARLAPPRGFQEWWLKVGTELVRRMKTRAWPLVSEVEAACHAVRSQGQGSAGEDAIDEMVLGYMTDWFRKFKSQMPGCGKASRTAALIDRGVLADIREARFRGFTLTPDQARNALDMPMGRDEAEHDERITADIRAIGARMERHRAEFSALRASVKPNEHF